jgi:hypothetical protein
MPENSKKITGAVGTVGQQEKDFQTFCNLAQEQLSAQKSIEYTMFYLAQCAKKDFDAERLERAVCWVFLREGLTATDASGLLGIVFDAYAYDWDGKKAMAGIKKITNDPVKATVLFFAAIQYLQIDPAFRKRKSRFHFTSRLLDCLFCAAVSIAGIVGTVFFANAGGVVVITLVMAAAGLWGLSVNLRRMLMPPFKLRKLMGE